LTTVLLAFPAVAGAAIRQRHTTEGQALAREVLLKRGDLGRGWREATSAPAKVPGLTCLQFKPPMNGVVEIGAAASPTWGQSSGGPFVSQDAYAYRSGSQESTAWRQLARPGYRVCVADALIAGGGQGVHFRVKHRSLFSLPGVGAAAAGYRVSGTASQSGQTIDVFLDVILLGGGSRISALSLSSFEQPVGRSLELRLARAAARRLVG
jgi:hypothetical protein